MGGRTKHIAFVIVVLSGCRSGEGGPVGIPSRDFDLSTNLAVGPNGEIAIAVRAGGTWADLGGTEVELPRAGGNFIASFDPTGTLLWAKPEDRQSPIRLDYASDGTLYAASGNEHFPGHLSATRFEDDEPFVARLDSTGADMWRKSIPHSRVNAVRALASGGMVFAGPGFITAVDATGEKLWERLPSDRTLTALDVDEGNNVYVGGFVNAPERTNELPFTAFIQMIDHDGTEAWMATFGGQLSNQIDDVILTKAGTLRASWDHIENSEASQLKIVALNPLSGDSTITSTLGFLARDEAHGALTLTRSGVTFVGRDQGGLSADDVDRTSGRAPTFRPSSALALLDLDLSGNLVRRTFVGSGESFWYPNTLHAETDGDDSVIVLGTSAGELRIGERVVAPASEGYEDTQVFLIKLGANRKVQWAKGITSHSGPRPPS